MANPHAGEVALVIDGQRHVARLTLGALAELEDRLGAGSLPALVERFEGEGPRAGDVLALICAGLRGGGWQGDLRDLAHAEIEGGVIEAARVAARLLALAFRGAQ
ncbi:GTA protein ORFG10 [Roseibacterium elongatum DSM 19469]|uniref:GTA protein ORFG10 n=1 Tax=Roseicyclus elongatus DSM 19469 TaxID=1294273 RepID=W8S728_9RHOB|nr:gene transfer agent family protein [Roseibacterium elongatum]AHM04746.1 GTA protein ORFG10 [Roseibacterium elongatum DSM 19469]